MLSFLKEIITDVREARIPGWLFWVIIVCAGIGFLDASFLSIEHVVTSFNGGGVNCIVGSPGSCNIVLESIYAKVQGIPLSYLGLLYYTAIIILITRLHAARKIHLWLLLRGIITCGFLASLYFVYLQLVVLRTICPYCMLSAAMSAIMFAGVVSHHVKKQLK